MTPTSNKNPILFPGEFFGAGAIGEVGDSRKFAAELKNLRGFSNETIVAAKFASYEENLDWIRQLDPANTIANMKLGFLQKQNATRRAPAIGIMMEERLLNPFLRLGDPHFQQLVETTEEHVVLEKLKAFQKLRTASPATTDPKAAF